ncbi:class I SAM-dependent methyltransferase [Streptomyces sp. VRA16 Mangrove soil]|uniref:class I SAM-dependent methyltransferase n=1 Tax=Streptomyces sp. VRA16 Mangrove soil TaxID=2817434 RepID=UPI001A9E3647|nr:class I SAM-dependent methyltransferase [Streptomyces sp. VRA16 Mangrove soil]MBO1333914.1 class I SAM-dependent methyltransferase [Streptomyces sp. VRA16 Mangrove soil]
MTHDASSEFALSFDGVAAQYAMARPTYPPQLFDTIEELTGRSLRGRRTLDVGAGTGIATALLRDRGADVIAVEPGPGMGAQLRATHPEIPLVRAYGDALPFADATADLITYAQSWHWTDPARSIPEALRVLRPGGTLALWWNIPDPDVEWTAAQERRLQDRLPGYHRHGVSSDASRIIGSLDLTPAPTTVYRRLHWTRRIPIDLHLAHLASRSYFVVMGPEAARPILESERAHLLAAFPNGTLEEAYALDLTLAHHP